MSEHISVKAVTATLRNARKASGITQAQLGKLLGMPQAHVSELESGRVDVRASTLIAWTRAVGMEFLVVPRSIVSAVRYLESEKPASGASPDWSSSLSRKTELDDD